MANVAVIGAQWGDEGKGKIVDWLSERADVVVRFQGGHNAGHTLVIGNQTYKLSLLPSGVVRGKQSIIGNGVVVDPWALLKEIETIKGQGVTVGPDVLKLAENAPLILPLHGQLDRLREELRGTAKIGTTGRGIGPAYADKAARTGIRLGDLTRPYYLRARLALVLPGVNRVLSHFGQPGLDLDRLVELAAGWGERLGPRIVDTLPMIQEAVRSGQSILLEGQLGVMRDLDWGTYPYVTSSNPLAGAACVGAGLPPTAITDVVGVVKAYSTAVGAGPFPAELHDETGAQLREVGQEYGATTGRPRRCGWFDGVAIRYAAWLNGFTALAVTKLDVLDGLPELKICVGYEIDGKAVQRVPDTIDLERASPIFESWPGWQTSTRDARRWDDLPAPACAYLERIAELAGVPLHYVSVGAEREQLIVL
jgi:adenylosuccinate synthase